MLIVLNLMITIIVMSVLQACLLTWAADQACQCEQIPSIAEKRLGQIFPPVRFMRYMYNQKRACDYHQ